MMSRPEPRHGVVHAEGPGVGLGDHRPEQESDDEEEGACSSASWQLEAPHDSLIFLPSTNEEEEQDQ